MALCTHVANLELWWVPNPSFSHLLQHTEKSLVVCMGSENARMRKPLAKRKLSLTSDRRAIPPLEYLFKKSRWVVGQTGFSLGFFYADWKRHSKSPTADAKVISTRIFLEFQALLFDVRKSKLTLKLTTRKRSRFWQRAKPKIYAREKNWWWWAKQHQDWVCNSNIYRKVFVSPQQNLSAKIPRNHFGLDGSFVALLRYQSR